MVQKQTQGHRKKKRHCPDFAAMLRERPAASLAEEIVRCFSSELLRAASRRCQHPELAEDAYQETLKIFLESGSQFRGEASILTWLNRLVTSACERLRRGRKNDPAFHLPLETVLEEAEEDRGPPDQELRLLLSERLEILGRLLMEVDEPNRSLLLLHEGQEVPLTELAQRYSLSVDGVKARLRRTRAALRARLREVAEGHEPI